MRKVYKNTLKVGSFGEVEHVQAIPECFVIFAEFLQNTLKVNKANCQPTVTVVKSLSLSLSLSPDEQDGG